MKVSGIKSVICISDVHGCYKTLVKLIEKLPKNIPICFVGDLIDRGPDSRKVIELVRSNKYYCVQSNHHDFMIDTSQIIGDGKIDVAWFDINNGGQNTYNNYLENSRFDEEEFIKDSYFLKQLPLYIEFPDCKKDKKRLVVSHSNIGPIWWYIKNEHKTINTREMVVWARNDRRIYNIIGHTIVKEPEISYNYANIDTGCAFGRKLTALQFPEMKIYQQENIEEN